MLILKPSCEHCNKSLPANSMEAMICSFECTFCTACVHEILQNVCPNCGGGFERRPVRPQKALSKYSMSQQEVHHPVDRQTFQDKLLQFSAVDPEDR
jgi:hypothetical protein